MTKQKHDFTRRQALSGLGGVSALAIGSGALGGCISMRGADGQPGQPDASSTPMRVMEPNAKLDDIAYKMLAHEPGRATSLGVDKGAYAEWRGTFGTPGMGGREAYQATLSELVEDAKTYPKEGLTADQQIGFEVVETAFSSALEGMALPYGDVAVGSWRNAPYLIIQNVGGYIDYARAMGSGQPVQNAQDVDFYLARLSEIPDLLDGELERVKEARAMGVIPPDFLLEKTAGQLDLTHKAAGRGDLFIRDLENLLKEADLSQDAVAKATPIVTGPIREALERQLNEIQSQRAEATSNAGMWAQPEGEAWYSWSTKASTTTQKTPDEIHEQGLEELAELHGRMDPILKELGYTKGTVGERMQALGDDKRYQFSPGDKGREEIISFINGQVDYIRAQLPRAFNELVDPPFEVRRIPIAEEVGAPGAYGGAGSKDGTIPGRFWINLRTPDLHRKYDLPDLTFHEAFPGHVWEGAFSNRLPLIRSILAFNAFSEGWALYAEQLADELGAYDDFKVGRLGYLQAIAFRACRLVVDTGLHHKRWTREQANRFFVERNGSKPEEVASEVDRYCSWPGQACGYKIGHSEIVENRARAQKALGDAYDFKAFNTAVILGGNAPLNVVNNTVTRYIEEARG
ncbi:MAG: DUF885 domain-containing protein [Pseudomonadota bacterium]